MSTTTPIGSPPRAAQRFGRVLRLVFGSLGVLAALAFITGAGALTWALAAHRDSSGYFTTNTHHYRTSSYALSTQSLDVAGTTGALADGLARIRITATSTDAAKPLFIGIARTHDVDRYLARVEHDELRDIKFDPFSIDYRRTSGVAPAALPATRSFWRSHVTGKGTRTISWPVQKGHWSAVVMNADGSRNVSVNAQLAARLSGAWWFVAGFIALGGLSLAGGVVLLRSGGSKQASLPTAERGKV